MKAKVTRLGLDRLRAERDALLAACQKVARRSWAVHACHGLNCTCSECDALRAVEDALTTCGAVPQPSRKARP